MSRDVEKVLTTGQVAKLIGVATRTVVKWHTKGLLKGYCLPDSRDRRFLREDVEEFMALHAIPGSDRMMFNWCPPTVVSPDPQIAGPLVLMVNDLKVRPDLAGMSYAPKARRGLVVIDTAIGVQLALTAVKVLTARGRTVYVLCREDEADPGRYGEAGAAGVFNWPCDLQQVAQALGGD